MRKTSARGSEACGSPCGRLEDAIPADELQRHAAMSAEFGGGQMHTTHLY